ncbi:MAG TPA: DUF1015 family protein [Rhodothermales bacterium]
MAIIHPFRALRPRPEKARDVACVPYDVIDTAEARRLAEGNPDSFLHVIRPEIDLPEGTDEHDDAVYRKGAENLEELARSGRLLTEATPALYVYRLVMNGREQTGLYGCVSVEDYDRDVILKHEKTRQDKEDDRTRHILEQRAHAEPVMLTYRDSVDVDRIVARTVSTEPLYDFEATDGIRHTIWRIHDPSEAVAAFAEVDHLYVADGHHRCKAASRTAERLRAEGTLGQHPEAAFFPAVLFPMSHMHIMPYNRVVYRVPGGVEALLETLRDRLGLSQNGSETPTSPGQIGVYARGRWYSATLPETRRGTVADQLDVARLSEHVLEPILGITDPRTDKNIGFVGGIRGTAELERLVESGKADVAISMYPTSIDELVDVSAAGQLMPPKSTWFEPKLRSGLLIHRF